MGILLKNLNYYGLDDPDSNGFNSEKKIESSKSVIILL